MLIQYLDTYAKRLSRAGLYEWMSEKFLEFCSEEKRSSADTIRVLSVGSGGAVEEAILKLGVNPDTVDIDPVRRPKILGDICEIDLGQDLYDVVFCMEVLEHLHSPASGIHNLERVLRPGGLLVLSTPFIFPIHEAPVDYQRFTRYGIELLLKSWTKVEVVPKAGALDSIAVLMTRMIRMHSRPYRLLGYLTVLLVIIFRPLVKRFGSQSDDFSITSGYFVSATKSICKSNTYEKL